MTKTKTILSQSGVFDAEGIDKLIENLRTKEELIDIKPANLKKVVSIIIEALENIYKYHKIGKEQQSLYRHYTPSFTIEKETSHIRLTFENPILKNDIQKLTLKLNDLSTLDMDALKILYIETIRNGEFTNQGGAGLGFIKMSRISKNQFVYSFNEIDKNSSVFTYTILIEN